MKNILFVLFFTLLSTKVVPQNSRVSMDIAMGTSFVADQSAVLENDFSHYGASFKYTLSNKFSLGISASDDNLNFVKGQDIRYQRITLEGYLNGMNILGFNNKYVNIVPHLGVGLSRFNTTEGTYFNENMGVVTSGVSLVVNISRPLKLKVDWTTAGNFSQDRTLDNLCNTTNRQLNSLVNNLSVGISLNLGKSEHMDWNKNKKQVRTEIIATKPILLEKTKIVEVSVPNKNNCDCDYIDFVYFDFNKTNVEKSELASIEKVADKLTSKKKIILTGWACPVYGSVKVNMEIAEARANSVKRILIGIGVQEDSIEVDVKGKDYSRSSEEVRALARRVDMRVVDK